MDRQHPDLRATVRRDGSIRIVDWAPWLATAGPVNTLLEARGRAGVGIADLTIIRDEDHVALEAVVTFRCVDARASRDADRLGE
ncbi:MAG: hypothetical protein ACR2LK_06540 [Solirubrobacteraceae bacterium]